jgi:hypothetical protein
MIFAIHHQYLQKRKHPSTFASLSTAPESIDANGNPIYKDNRVTWFNLKKFKVPQKKLGNPTWY